MASFPERVATRGLFKSADALLESCPFLVRERVELDSTSAFDLIASLRDHLLDHAMLEPRTDARMALPLFARNLERPTSPLRRTNVTSTPQIASLLHLLHRSSPVLCRILELHIAKSSQRRGRQFDPARVHHQQTKPGCGPQVLSPSLFP